MTTHKNRIAALYRQYSGELVGFLSRRVVSRELAHDLVQELFVRLLARENSVAAIRHDRGFLFSSARHLAAEVQTSPGWRLGDGEALNDGDGESLPSPESTCVDKQKLDRLLRLIGELPPRCREVFILHKFDGVPYAEIAVRLDISVSAVEKHMMRALADCREILDERGDGKARR